MAFSYVQQANAGTNSSVTSLSTAPVSTAAGNHLFLHARWEAGDTAASVSDSAGNTYVAIAASKSSQGAHSQWFYCLNAKGSASNVVTLTMTVAQSYVSIRLIEFSASNPVFEKSVTSTVTSSAAISSPSFNTGAAGLVLVGESSYNTDGTSSNTFSANYTPLVGVWNYSREAYRITTAPLSNEVVTYTGIGASNRAMDVLSFTEGGAAAATDTPVSPGNGALTLVGYAPTVTRTANQSTAPGAASVAVTGYAPQIAQGVTVNVAPGVSALAVTGYAPSVVQGAAQGLTPNPAALTVSGYAPTVDRTANVTLAPQPAGLSVTGYAPSVAVVAPQPVSVPLDLSTLAITGYAPMIYQGAAQQPIVDGSGAGGSVREVRKFADLLDKAHAKPSRSQKKARRRQLEAEALELLPDLPEAEKIAPIAARIVYEQEARALAPLYADRPVQSLSPVFDAHAALRELLDKLLAEALEQQKVAEDEENDVELLLFGT